MERLSKFYSELSNEDRLRILFLISKERLNLTQISLKIGSSMQETSRNLSKLKRDRFVRKTDEGYYRITSYGKASLQVAVNHKYLCKYQDYFVKHSISAIPTKLVCRIGEMENSTRFFGVMKVISQIEDCIERSEQQILLMYDQLISNSLLTIEKKVQNGINLKQIFPKDIDLSADFAIISNDASIKRVLDKVKNFILITEKEALVAHSGPFDRIDYSEAFLTQDDISRGWCFDLFNYFWEKADSYSCKASGNINHKKVQCSFN